MRNRVWYAVLLLILLNLIIYSPVATAQDDSSVTVFIVDTKVDFSFIENLTMTNEIKHGSVVGRIIYQEVPEVNLRSYGVEKEGEINKSLYYDALRKIAVYQQQHPQEQIIVNISLSFSKPAAEHKELINDLAKQGVIVVAAAGNESSERAIYPAGFSGALAVGNATKKGKADSSNYGEFIDFCAPGDVEYISRLYLPQGVTIKNFKAVGTSYSAPRVVALVAELLIREPNLSPARAVDLIANNTAKIADPLFEEGLLGTGVIDIDRTLAQVDTYYYLKTYGVSFLWALLILALAIYWWRNYHWGVLFLVILLMLVVMPLLFLVQEMIVGNAQQILSSYQQLQLIDWLCLLLIPGIIIAFTSWKKKFVLVNYFLGFMVLSIGLSVVISLGKYRLFYWRGGLCLIALGFIFSEKWRIYQANNGNDISKLVTLLSSHSPKVVQQAKYKLKSQNYSLKRLLKILKQKNITLDVVKEVVMTKGKKEEIVEELLTIFEQGEQQSEEIVIQILSELAPETVIKKVKVRLVDASPQVQYRLLRLLAELQSKDEEVMQEIITILFADNDMWLRYQALVTLTAVSSSLEELETIIAELCFDSQEIIRLEAQNLWAKLEN